MDDFEPRRPFSIALDVDEPDLRRALAEALRSRPQLRLAEPGAAVAAIVTDHPAAPWEQGSGPPVIVVEPSFADALPGRHATAGLPARRPIFALAAADPHLILSAAHLVAAGFGIAAGPTRPGAWEDREADQGHGDDAHHDERLRRPAALTTRERQVLELLVQGASNKLIARALSISVHTAKFHVAAVMDKLGGRNRSDTVAIALRDGHVRL
jgi:DNA-binding CsgD family transcriptional regulator